MKTAVEFAVEKLEQFIPSGNQMAIGLIFEQAKEIEKEQQMKTYKVALMRGMSYDEDVYHENKWRDPEKYYNETFKQQEQ
jgi:hypothetical protein